MAFSTSNRLGIDFTKAITVLEEGDAYITTDQPPLTLGTTAEGTNAGFWILCQANGSIPQGGAVSIDGDFQATALVTGGPSTGMQVGIAGAAATDEQYVWVQRHGVGLAFVGASAVGYAALHTTATAGLLDDATSADDVNNVFLLVTAPDENGLYEVWINWPQVGTLN